MIYLHCVFLQSYGKIEKKIIVDSDNIFLKGGYENI